MKVRILKGPILAWNCIINPFLRADLLLYLNNLPRLLICLSFFSALACTKSEEVKVVTPKPEKEIEEFAGPTNDVNRVKVIRLYKDTVYTLSKSLLRKDGEQLIIDEGTLIKVRPGELPVTINIEPGGVILANGSERYPIVFTLYSSPGNQIKQWGGIIIHGRASNNNGGGIGIQEDFSGTLNYVRIEFAALNLNNVGNRTLLDNIQVSYAGPGSAFTFDGGTFDAKHLISYACSGPADFYYSNGFTGNMQFLLSYRHPFFGQAQGLPVNTLAGLYIENNATDPLNAQPLTFPILSNVSVIGPSGQAGQSADYVNEAVRSAALVTTGNAFFRIRNSIFMGFPKVSWYIDDFATASHVNFAKATAQNSIFQAMDANAPFYLKPGSYLSYNSSDFKNFATITDLKNELYNSIDEFKFINPFTYDLGPNPNPSINSPLLTGSDFSGQQYEKVFFEKVNFRGALGDVNWLKNWTNFTPLKTKYNLPD